MKSLLVLVAGLALVSTASVDAKTKKQASSKATKASSAKSEKSSKSERSKSARSEKSEKSEKSERRTATGESAKRQPAKPRAEVAARAIERKLTKKTKVRGRKPKRIAAMFQMNLGPAPGQSVGAPWMGRLQDAAQMPEGDRYVIRRPGRAFGTTEAVGITKAVIDSILGDFPDAHALAIGDMSAEHGGQITQHRSHQAGRDLDLGLFYATKPTSYPDDFVSATQDNLDFATTFAILDAFGDTASEPGGVQVMLLDYKVQGMLYEWAKDHLVEVEHLEKLFQYPHGRGAPNGLVRHEPNHDNHIHIRFKCPAEDTHCQY